MDVEYHISPEFIHKLFFDDRSNFMKEFPIKRERTSVLSRLSGSISAKATATKADWNFIFLSKIYFSLSSYRSTFKIVIHQAIHQGLGGLASIITRSRHLVGTSQVRNRQSPMILCQYLGRLISRSSLENDQTTKGFFRKSSRQYHKNMKIFHYFWDE